MDHSAIARKLVDLYPDYAHDFSFGWKDAWGPFPNWEENYIVSDLSRMLTPKNNLNAEIIQYNSWYDMCGEDYIKFKIIISPTGTALWHNAGIYDGPYSEKSWEGFSPDNAFIPKVFTDALNIIHGTNWIDNTTIDYKVIGLKPMKMDKL